MQALAKMAKEVSAKGSNIGLEIVSSNKKDKVRINGSKKRLALPTTSREFSFIATGKGVALVELTYSYDTQTEIVDKRFNLTTNWTMIKGTTSGFELKACVSTANETNTEMEILLPASYKFKEFAAPLKIQVSLLYKL